MPWNCDACTMKNADAASQCSACGSARSVGRSIFVKPPVSKWECPTCTFKNNPDKPTCNMCNNARPPEPLLIDYDALNAEIAGDLNAIHAALPIAYAMLALQEHSVDFAKEYAKLAKNSSMDALMQTYREVGLTLKRLRQRSFEHSFADDKEKKTMISRYEESRKDVVKISRQCLDDIQQLVRQQVLRKDSLNKDQSELAQHMEDVQGFVQSTGAQTPLRAKAFVGWWMDQKEYVQAQQQKYLNIANGVEAKNETKTEGKWGASASSATSPSSHNSASGSGSGGSGSGGGVGAGLGGGVGSGRSQSPSARATNRRGPKVASQSEQEAVVDFRKHISEGVALIASLATTGRELQQQIKDEIKGCQNTIASLIEFRANAEGMQKEMLESAADDLEDREQLERWGVKDLILKQREKIAKMRFELEMVSIQSDQSSVTIGKDAQRQAELAINAEMAKLESLRKMEMEADSVVLVRQLSKGDSKRDGKQQQDQKGAVSSSGRWSSLFNRNISETVSRTGVVARRSLADYEKKKAVKKSNDKDLHQTLTADFMGRDCFLLEFDLKKEDQLELFENEVVMRHALKHPLIDPVEAVFQDASHGYIQLRAHARSLEEWVKGSPKHWEVQSAFLQLLRTLEYCHSRGLVHNNLTLGNCWMSTQGHAVLSNFSLSGWRLPELGTQISRLRPTTLSRQQTQAYLASEVLLSGTAASPAADLWSFGIMLYKAHFPSVTPILDTNTNSVPIPNHSNQRLRDLLGQLLQSEPRKRPTATEALGHPYFVVSYARDLTEDRKVVESRDKIESLLGYLRNMPRATQSEFLLRFKRENIVDYVCSKFATAKRTDLLKRVKVEYTDFKGQDDGGLTADLFTEFFLRVVEPSFRIFECAAADDRPIAGAAYLPHPECKDLSQLRAVGRMMAKCLIDGRVVPVRFAPSLYKFILDIRPNLRDLELYDRTEGEGLRKMLTMDSVEELALDFGDVKKDGASIPVTDENKHEYVDLVVQQRLLGARVPGLQELRTGFMTLELKEYIGRFNAEDLMSVLVGEDKIDVSQIISNLEFVNFTTGHTKSAMLTVLRELSQPNLKRFLRLATASYSVPRGGFERKIVIQSNANLEKLPVGHTCSYTIDLPDYQHVDMLRAKLLVALEHVDATGFDFV